MRKTILIMVCHARSPDFSRAALLKRFRAGDAPEHQRNVEPATKQLKRVALAQNLEESLDQYQEIEPQAPVIDVPKVELDPFLDVFEFGGRAAGAIALRPARHSRLDVTAESIIAQHLLKLKFMSKCVRARPDQ